MLFTGLCMLAISAAGFYLAVGLARNSPNPAISQTASILGLLSSAFGGAGVFAIMLFARV